MSDKDTSKFNKRRNKQKAIICLKGILSGVIADELLSDTELLFLHSWVDNQEYLHDDPDVFDIRDTIQDILADGLIQSDELDDLNCLIADVLNYRLLWPDDKDGKINEFLGFLSGITADDNINPKEFDSCKSWLENNSRFLDYWPFSAVAKRITDAEADGIVTEDERKELNEFCKGLAGHDFLDTGLAVGMSLEYFTSIPVNLALAGKNICLTGNFIFGKRSLVSSHLETLGASLKSKISNKCDYLIVGSIASKDWMFTSYGRKIEEALKLQEDGSSIQIISEHALNSLLMTNQ